MQYMTTFSYTTTTALSKMCSCHCADRQQIAGICLSHRVWADGERRDLPASRDVVADF